MIGQTDRDVAGSGGWFGEVADFEGDVHFGGSSLKFEWVVECGGCWRVLDFGGEEAAGYLFCFLALRSLFVACSAVSAGVVGLIVFSAPLCTARVPTASRLHCFQHAQLSSFAFATAFPPTTGLRALKKTLSKPSEAGAPIGGGAGC